MGECTAFCTLCIKIWEMEVHEFLPALKEEIYQSSYSGTCTYTRKIHLDRKIHGTCLITEKVVHKENHFLCSQSPKIYFFSPQFACPSLLSTICRVINLTSEYPNLIEFKPSSTWLTYCSCLQLWSSCGGDWLLIHKWEWMGLGSFFQMLLVCFQHHFNDIISSVHLKPYMDRQISIIIILWFFKVWRFKVVLWRIP